MKVYGMFLKSSLMGYMEYRANLYAALTMELVYLCSKLLYVAAIYNTGIDINGLSPDQIMLFIGTYIIMTAIYTGLFIENFYKLPEHIRNGSLDIYITKPLSLQFMATMRHINFVLPVPNLIAGVILIATACSRLHIEITFLTVLGYMAFLVSSTCVTYAIFLIPQILTFWTVKSYGIFEIMDRCWDFNNMPMNIYTKWIQRIGVFIIPVFFITNLPAKFLIGNLSEIYIIWTFVAPILFLTAARLFWKFAVRSYVSASS